MNVNFRMLSLILLACASVGGGSVAQAKPILFVLESPGCIPCQNFHDDWHANDAMRNALCRVFDVRTLPPHQWTRADASLSKPAFIVRDAPGRIRQPVVGYRGAADLLQRLGVTMPASPVSLSRPVSDPRPSKLESRPARSRQTEPPVAPSSKPTGPPTPPQAAPSSKPTPANISAETSIDDPGPVFVEVVPDGPADDAIAGQSAAEAARDTEANSQSSPSLIGRAIGYGLTAVTTYGELKYGLPFSLAAGGIGWLVGRGRQRRRRKQAGGGMMSSPAGDRVAPQILKDLSNLRTQNAQLREQLEQAEQTVQYTAPPADDGLADFRRAMKQVSDSYPSSRTWVQMFEHAFNLIRSGERKSA